MGFKKINNYTGWAVCIFACAVYLLTMEATGSFWDCGEFVSSCYKLQIPHPPGAPLFVLMGRIFTLPFDGKHAATGVNTMSALASGFTILFLFWSITHFARKLVQKGEQALDNGQLFMIMAAGVVGALAYTFSDAFWYSAVEGEVYACSSFFTAIVFWAILKWEHEVTEEKRAGIKGNFTRADRWLILIFYLIGLAVGVHLLNLLTIPSIVMVYYFKRYNATPKGTFFAFLTGCVILGIVQIPVIQWTIKWAGQFDIFFKNSLGMPFFVGFGFFFVLMAVVIFLMIRLANRRNWNFLKLAMWGFAFIVLGFSTYYTTLIRSNSDPAVDMFNVDNPVSLVGYLSREQYGDWPILFGQDFTSEVTEQKPIDTYVKGKDKYEKSGRRYETDYGPDEKHFFPRMWDASNEQQHADYYLGFTHNVSKDPKTGKYEGKPTMGDNISYFVQYQINWMYWRYFMWNFAGKQNDIEGIDVGNVRDGNWLTGISFWDNLRLGDQSKMPDSMKNNKSHNTLFCLPLILGILGLVYQYKRNKRDLLVVGLLFFFTGFAIVMYLNQAGNQPRERDYAYAGSFYAFAFWIGIGVLYVRELFQKFMNSRVAQYTSAAVCALAVPVLMGFQEWDDHDRSKKVLARDLAIDYLESCAPNAILITFGDNDTYPLWYAQEVEGVRRDIRVINSSLLGTDWYINQLRYKVNQSDPIDVIWTPEQILGSKRDGIYFAPSLPAAMVDQTQPLDLYTMMKDYAGSDDPSRMAQQSETESFNIYPTKKVKIPVDINVVRQNGTVNATDSVLNEVAFDIPRNVLGKNESAILNIIAANKWKRPIYFTSQYRELGFQNYLRTDGLTFRLVPIKQGDVNVDWAYDKMMNKFVFGNADKKGVYYDEENRRHLNSIRMQFAIVGNYLAEHNKKDSARKLLERCDKMLLQENFPYGLISRGQQHNQISSQFLLASYKAGDTVLAAKVAGSLRKDLEQQITYFNALPEDKQTVLSDENNAVMELLRQLQQMEQYFKNPLSQVINKEANKTITNNPPAQVPDTQVSDK